MHQAPQRDGVPFAQPRVSELSDRAALNGGYEIGTEESRDIGWEQPRPRAAHQRLRGRR